MIKEHPTTGEKIELIPTAEYWEMVTEALGHTCGHDKISEPRTRKVAGGGVQIKQQCLRCGEAQGQPRKKSDYPNAPPFDEELVNRAKVKRARVEFEIAKKFVSLRNERSLRGQEWYDKYLKSEDWFHKKKLVLKRAKSVCEGCGEAKATEVHHLTYDNVGAEFLFELVAICRPCHERYHAEPSDAAKEYDERPCRACRFQADGECLIYGVSEQLALQSEEYCGSELRGFEDLK